MTVLLVLGGLLLIPICALVAFNYTVYGGLRDIVQLAGVGKAVGDAVAEQLQKQGLDSVTLPEFTRELRKLLKTYNQEMGDHGKGFRGWLERRIDGTLLFVVGFVLNRIAKGCVENGRVNVQQFATHVGERADQMVIDYLRTVLWDLTRLLLILGAMILWLVMWLLSLVLNWIL